MLLGACRSAPGARAPAEAQPWVPETPRETCQPPNSAITVAFMTPPLSRGRPGRVFLPIAQGETEAQTVNPLPEFRTAFVEESGLCQALSPGSHGRDGHLCWSCSGSRAPPRCPLWVGLTHALGPEVLPAPRYLVTAGEPTTRM